MVGVFVFFTSLVLWILSYHYLETSDGVYDRKGYLALGVVVLSSVVCIMIAIIAVVAATIGKV